MTSNLDMIQELKRDASAEDSAKFLLAIVMPGGEQSIVTGNIAADDISAESERYFHPAWAFCIASLKPK